MTQSHNSVRIICKIMRKDWTYKKLGDVVEITMGQSPSSDSFNNGSEGLPFFQGNADFGKLHPRTRVYCSTPIRLADKDDVLISVRAPIGAINIADRLCCIGRGLAAIRGNSQVSSLFIYYLLLASRDKLIAQGTGSTFKAIGKDVLRSLEMPIIPLKEQNHIVAELDLLNGILEKQRLQLKELDTLAQSVFCDLFGSIDDNKNGFPVESLGSVFTLITDGTHQTPEYTEDTVHGYKFLSAKDVVSGTIDWSRIKYIPEYLHKELHKRLAPQRGDILLCKNGTTGICALVDTDEVFDIYVSLALLRTTRDLSRKYLVAAINHPSTKRQFDESLKGVGVPNLHLGEIKKARIIVPPNHLQNTFAHRIEAIEHQKALVNQSLVETQKLFEYTMDKYFG